MRLRGPKSIAQVWSARASALSFISLLAFNNGYWLLPVTWFTSGAPAIPVLDLLTSLPWGG